MFVVHYEERPSLCPLTESQKGIYLECLGEPESLMYNITFACGLPSGTNISDFVEAVKTVVKNHDAFGVTISAPGGIPTMVYKELNLDVNIVQKEITDLGQECQNFVKPFDFEDGPLYRFEICKMGDKYIFLFDIHHIIFDGMSVRNFVSEIAKVYSGEGNYAEEINIFDVSKAEQINAVSPKVKEEIEYFDKKFSGISFGSKPISDVIAEKLNGDESCVIVNTDNIIDKKDVSSFIDKYDVNENALFMGAFAYTLSKFTGSRDSFFCTAHHGRNDKNLLKSIGMFVKTLPMYYTFDEKTDIPTFIKEVYDDYYREKKMSVPFGELASKYELSNDVTFVYQSDFFNSVEIEGEEMPIRYMNNTDNVCDFDIMVVEKADNYEIWTHFRKEVYSKAFIEQFVKMYLNILKQMLTVKHFEDIVFVEKDGDEILKTTNKTEVPYDSEKTVIDMFKEQVKKTPDKICLVYKDKKFTYSEIDDMTDMLAHHLIRAGITKEKIVGVLIPRCEYMLICSLGILKAGGAYMPLDPTYPPERINLMLQDSQADMLIFASDLIDIVDDNFEGKRVSIDDIKAMKSLEGNLSKVDTKDLFILLYTSGSTGMPKGVMFEHSNVMVTTEWVKKCYDMDEHSKVAAYASYGFDANVFDMYPAITSGAELHIISEDIRLDLMEIKRYFNENGITNAVMTTQIGQQFALLDGLETLESISVGGEKLIPLDPPKDFKMYNLYGPTEGSIVTSGFLLDCKYTDVPIGKPVDNLKIYIVDKGNRLLPSGSVGELWIAGPHVTRGYLNRPEKTKEAYGENPFSDEKGYERIYKTGDIVRLLPDGNIQFIGRNDAQVKIRGFRIELTEIEEVIRRYDGIKDLTVVAFDEPSGGKYIAAYVVSDEKVDIQALADFIRAEKPPYMVPAVIMQIDAIPLNQNHKVDKRALPVPEREVEEIVAPENQAQEEILNIVSEVVGHKNFGITTNIYDAGLTSIGAVKLNVMLAEKFDVTVKISDIKENDTVKKLEKFILSATPQSEYEALEDYPITATQEGIFVECMSLPDTTVYNIPLLVRLDDEIDIGKLSEAIVKSFNAHSYIKTTLFSNDEGNIRAKRNDDADVEVNIIDLEELPSKESLLKPFNLTEQSLYRVEIYRTKNGNYLYIDIHHIISDGTSEAIILNDINRAYMGEDLEKEKFSGFEIALEEKTNRNDAIYEKSKEYWKKILSGCDTENLPKLSPENTDGGSGRYTELCDVDLEKIKTFCDEKGITLNAYFNSAFSFVMNKFTGKENVTYATVYNGRNDSRFSNAVTMLVKTLPVTVYFEDDTKTIDLIKSMQNQIMESMSNDSCSFAELSKEYGVNADILFVYQGDSFNFDYVCGKKAEIVDIPSDEAKADISVVLSDKDERIEIVVDYRRNKYDSDFVQSLCDSLSAAANLLMQYNDVKDISLLTERAEEHYDILNDTEMKIENISCVDIFEKNVESNSQNKAVVVAGESLTFGELNKLANRMAHNLLDLGVKKDTIVGIVLDRTKEIAVAEIGILKAGGAYLPMLPTYPDDRIEYCLDNSDSPILITTEKIKAERASLFADDKPYKTITVEELISNVNEENPNIEISPEQLAYCIYTSGSTGTPKGVMIEHKNLSNFYQTHKQIYDFYTNEEYKGVALGMASISFDMSIMEIILPLFSGRCVCMTTDEEAHNPLMLRDLMLENNVQMMICTPSFMNNIVGIPEMSEPISKLKSLIVGAEAFTSSLYDSIRKVAPDVHIYNGYGPTECSICSSVKELHDNSKITIGRPTGNVKMYVVDKFGNILPPFAVGELIICGECVGRGYVKLPEKNKAAFFELRGLPAYHSGDLVRLDGNSEIDFGGRIDNQVKLRGFRVELDEIEKVMTDFEGVTQSKVLVRNNETEDYLVGFFTAETKIDVDELVNYMKSRLTYYMIPAVMLQIDKMPLTPNGKVDKKGFPDVKNIPARKKIKKAPKKSMEQRLCEIFATVLSLDEVYADDNFFELGGTSLSASKVTMLLLSDNVTVKYGDIFDNPTPETLADFIEQRNTGKESQVQENEHADTQKTREALKYNSMKYANEVKRESLGDILLTGAVGFLGIHILRELIESETGKIYCLVRRGEHKSSEIRLKTMLVYYFGMGFDAAFKDRIEVLEADITDESLVENLSDISFDTVINCAACVKHYSNSDILERINVHGVENLIDVCLKKNAKIIQISTISVPGFHNAQTYEKRLKMYENEFFVIDDADNKYVISKYTAEQRIYDAIEQNGLRGKVVRVGNLMGRYSDGEFQANMQTNMFMSTLKGFSVMKEYPISSVTGRMSFSPIDCTAKAVVLLAGTNDKFTAFNADNRYGFDAMKLYDACNKNGIEMSPVDDDLYFAHFKEKLADDSVNSALNGLVAYSAEAAHPVETDNTFTANILYRIGFSWPLTNDEYLERAIYSVMTLDYFDIEDSEY